MNRMTFTIVRVALVSCAACTLAYAGGELTIDWYTIDGGGATQSTGGDFVLSGTIGQAGASATLTGGDLRLTGDFWAVAVPTCGCLSDLDNDGQRTGTDIQGFVACLTAFGSNCACADVDGVPGLDFDDVAVFVADLLDGAACP